MLVVGALIQIVAFLFEIFAPPFPVFALSFALAGMGSVFEVSRSIKKLLTDNILLDSF
jgi:hypothetical protein